MKKIVFAISLLVIAGLTACNLQANPAQPAAQNPAPGGPAVAQSQNNNQSVQLGGQAQASPTPAQGYEKVVLGDGIVPEVRSIEVSSKVVYYGNPGCEPRETIIKFTVYDKDHYSARYGYYIDGQPEDAYSAPNSPVTWEYWVGAFPDGEVWGEHTFETSLDSKSIEQMLGFANLPWGEHTFQLTAALRESPDTSNRTWLYIYNNYVRGHDMNGDYMASGPVFPIIKALPCYPTPMVVTLLPTSAPGSDTINITVAPPVLDIPTDTPAPTQPPADTPAPTQPPTDTPAPAVQTRSGYVELRDWYGTGETADMDFSGANELTYIAARSDDPRHGLGQYVNQGEGIMMARTSSPSYENCRAVNVWYPGIAPVQVGETYCYQTSGGIYGYFRIDKIENLGGEIAQWVIGLSYTVWIP